MDKKIFAVDFDGTLCENKYPEIGNMNFKLISKLKKLQSKGHKLILWTCRCGERLNEAIKACWGAELAFDAVNENLLENIIKHDNDCRKIYADYYIDDKNLGVKRIGKYRRI